MPKLETVVETHSRKQKQIAQRAARKLATLWRQINPNRIAASWRDRVNLAYADLTLAQATAAAAADPYIAAALAARNMPSDQHGQIDPVRFAGVASDGRDMRTLLQQPVIETLTAIQHGETSARALARGLIKLDVIVRTQVADAGRVAEATAMASRPAVKGYVRMLSLPSCSRCIILAGRWYRWNTEFLRHPRCDCRMIPADEDATDDLRTDPLKAFESMEQAEQDKVFTKAGAEAIRLGADMSRVVNSRRGMYPARVFGQDVMATRETARGRGRGSSRRIRLMPEQIMIEAKGDRTEAIRLLRFHGYIR